MRWMMPVLFAVLALSAGLAVFPVSASAQDVPPPANWPWRGVELDMTGGDAEAVAGIARGLGANSVRIDIAPRWTMSKYGCSVGKAWDLNLSWADRVLDACDRFGVTGIISYSQYPEDPNAGYIQDDERFWESPADRAAFMDNVRKIVARFKGRGRELGGYYFMIEPLERKGGRAVIPDAWPEMAGKIVASVRSLDGDRWVVINPGPGGLVGGFRTLEPMDDPYVIYSAHMYMPPEYTSQGANRETRDFKSYGYPGRVGAKYWDKAALDEYLGPVARFQEEYGRLVWIGEFSAIRWAPGAEEYLDDCIDVFQEHGWGWCFFAFGGYHGWSLHYDERFSTNADRAKTVSDGPSARWRLLERKLSAPYPAGEGR